MKPFNLKAALNGEPVITRNGSPVTKLHLFDCKSRYKLLGVVNDELISFTEEGRSIGEHHDNANDLFMVPKKRSGWINIYKDGGTSTIHKTRESADRFQHISRVACVRVEWEE